MKTAPCQGKWEIAVTQLETVENCEAGNRKYQKYLSLQEVYVTVYCKRILVFLQNTLEIT